MCLLGWKKLACILHFSLTRSAATQMMHIRSSYIFPSLFPSFSRFDFCLISVCNRLLFATGKMLSRPFKSFSIAIAFAVLARALPMKDGARNTTREAFSSREYFYIGGRYVQMGNGHLFTNQMYVEKLAPLEPCQPYPLLFIHGQAQSGTVSDIEPMETALN